MTAVRANRRQDDFSAGMVRDVAPELIAEDGLYDLLDGLLDEDGIPYRRGGSAYLSTDGLGADGLTWIWDGHLGPGARTVVANASDFGALDGSDAVVNLGGGGLTEPKQSAVLNGLLFIGGGTIYGGSRKSAPYSTGTVKVVKGSTKVEGSGVTWNTLVDAGMLFHIGSERVYVVESIDSSTELTLSEPYGGSGGSGKSYVLETVHSFGSGPYKDFDYVTVCANRLVLLSGSTVLFTEIDNPHSFTNSLGTTNEHSLPEGVDGLGLATVGQTVLIFTSGGVFTLDGLAFDIVDRNGNPQHRVQQLSKEIVLTGAAALAGSGQQLVVPATDGIYLMDGISQPVRISRPLDRLYRELIAQRFKLGKAAVYRSHYFLPIIDSTGAVRDLLVCRLDRPARSRSQTGRPWSRFSGDGGEIPAFTIRTSRSPHEFTLLGAQGRESSRVVELNGFFSPSAAIKNDADGSTFDLDLITRDFETGAGTDNALRALRVRYELVDGGTDAPTLRIFYSDGALQTGEARWDEVTWDDFEWAGESGTSFTPVGELPVSDGRDPKKVRINKNLRYVRFRVKSEGPAAYCSLRSLELAIRPSKAVRR